MQLKTHSLSLSLKRKTEFNNIIIFDHLYEQAGIANLILPYFTHIIFELVASYNLKLIMVFTPDKNRLNL